MPKKKNKWPVSRAHRNELRDGSAISRELAAARGYASIVGAARLVAHGFASTQARPPGLLIPLHGLDGSVVGHQFKPDEPRIVDKRPVKYETPKGMPMQLDVPPTIRLDVLDAEITLWITEGIKKADAAATAGLACIGLIGVDCWQGTRSDGTRGPLEAWDDIPLDGREVVVAFDSDWMTKPGVRAAMDRLVNFLRSRGAVVHVIRWPERLDKLALDDWFAEGGTVAGLEELVVQPEPSILVGRDGRVVMRDAIKALDSRNDPPTLFQRDGLLVEAAALGVQVVSRDRLAFLMSESAEWVKVVGKSTRPAEPPKAVVANVAVAGPDLWPFPLLNRIVTTPVFAEDGSLRTEPGYHAASKSLYVPPEDLVIPTVSDKPTKKDIKRARALVDDLLQDFVFTCEADKTHAVAMLLQPFARELIRGETPMYDVEAHVQGTGKTKLVHSVLAPAVGDVDSMAECKDDTEMEKRLTSALREAMPVFFLDNVSKPIAQPSLASALTKPTWTGRVLAQSATVTMQISCTFVMTANNPTFSPDMQRRVVAIRLDARVEDPSKRTGFAHSLPAWALEHRGELIWAACTLIRAWIVAGRPPPPDDTPVLGSYGPWRRVLGGITALHGYCDFLGNLSSTGEDSDPDRETFEAVLAAVLEQHGADKWFLSKDVGRAIYHDDDFDTPVISGDHANDFANNFGYFLRSHRGQYINGHRLERAPAKERRSGGNLWRFARVESE